MNTVTVLKLFPFGTSLRVAWKSTHASQAVIPIPPPLAVLASYTDSSQAEKWIEEFKHQEIPKTLVDFSFSRSSGPGGQNVNKVNTKATLRCPIDSSWIPLWAREHIKGTPFYVSASQSILITSTVSRSQAQNVRDCLLKLHALILSASSTPLLKEPSEAQKERVREFRRAEKAKRKIDKDRRSEVKRNRSKRD